jgi:signal transduction histidine kinase/GAF domain-containing protein
MNTSNASVRTGAAPHSSSDPIEVLVEASATLLASPELKSVLPRILALAKTLIAADGYAVWRTLDQGHTWSIVASDGLSPQYQRDLIANAGRSQMPPTPIVVPDVNNLDLLSDRREGYLREGIRSMLAVPLIIGGTASGTIVFYYRTPHEFHDADVRYATTLANLAAAALSTAELYERQLADKRRSVLIAEAATVLASSLDFEATLQRVADLAVAQVADWCVVHLFENEKLTRVAVAAADLSKIRFAEEVSRKYPEQLTPERGAGKVLATGAPELIAEVTDDMIVAAARDQEHLRLIRQLGIVSAITVPLIARGKTIGVLRLISAESQRRFHADDLALATELARRAAVAIDNARLHRELETANSIMQLTHEAAHVGTWYLDPANVENNRWSPETYRLGAFSSDWKPDYQQWLQRVHPEDREKTGTVIQQAIATGDSFTIEYRLQGMDGAWRWHESRGRVHRTESGALLGVSGITLDITERRIAEQALLRTEKLAAAGRLAATIAHEINNPLEAVTNLVFLCARDEQTPEHLRSYLCTAEDELRHVAQIVRHTLGFYRENGLPEAAQMQTLVEAVLQLYRKRLEGKSIRVRAEYDPQAIVHVVSGELKQVLANLVSNAIDANDPGGELAVRVTRNDTGVKIAVSDSGHGIAPEHQARLFEPFFTTKKDIGTGLGLWVSRQLVEKYGGTIEMTSPSNGHRGSTFIVSIPERSVAQDNDVA